MNVSRATRIQAALIGLLALGLASAAFAAIQPGSAPPDFTLNVATKGNINRPNDFRARRVILLDVDHRACAPCRKVLGVMQKLEKRHAGEGIQISPANSGGPLAERVVPKDTKDPRISFPVLLDRDYAVAGSCGVETIPSIVLGDTKGVARLVHIGYQDDLEVRLTKLIDQYRPK
ncbi:MAG TPA: TlpA disulfide reductase family protein [Armatimonadota bacterium]|nr:TlpA disulfide reductase family protein [Armatimonadota bacterium]